MTIQIDKNLPIPFGKYPFHKLEPSDSFFVPKVKMNNLSGSIDYARKRWPGRKFIARTVDGGVRIWRVK